MSYSQGYLRIKNAGFQTYDKNYEIHRPNGRRDIHILFAVSDRVKITTGRGEQYLEKGSFRLFVPYEMQHYEFLPTEKGPSESFWVHFDGSGAKDLLKGLSLWHSRVVSVSSSKEVYRLFRQLIEEYEKRMPGHDTLCAGLLMQLLVILSRYANIPAYSGKEEVVESVLEYIYRNLSEPLTVEELAKVCHLSVGRFAHLFNEVTGTSPIRYVNEMRVEKAKNLLVSTAMNINEISASLGYTDPFYFSTQFRKIVGTTPSKYRKSQM